MQPIYRQILCPRTWFAGYVCWFLLLFFLSSRSVIGPDVQTFPHSDKLVHATYFAVGSSVLGIGLLLRRRDLPHRHLFWILLAAALVVGAFDEWHQSHTIGRSGNDLGDLAADCVGGVIGFFVAIRLFGFAKGRGMLARVAV